MGRVEAVLIVAIGRAPHISTILDLVDTDEHRVVLSWVSLASAGGVRKRSRVGPGGVSKVVHMGAQRGRHVSIGDAATLVAGLAVLWVRIRERVLLGRLIGAGIFFQVLGLARLACRRQHLVDALVRCDGHQAEVVAHVRERLVARLST